MTMTHSLNCIQYNVSGGFKNVATQPIFNKQAGGGDQGAELGEANSSGS